MPIPHIINKATPTSLNARLYQLNSLLDAANILLSYLFRYLGRCIHIFDTCLFFIFFKSKPKHNTQENRERQRGEPPLPNKTGNNDNQHHQIKANDDRTYSQIKYFHGQLFLFVYDIVKLTFDLSVIE